MSLKVQNKTLFVISLILIIVMIEPVFADHTHSSTHTNQHSGQSHQHTDSNEMAEEVTGEMSGEIESSSIFESREQEVMPFSLEETLHVFTDTDFGGVQQVITKDKTDQEQISLIQSHLQTEATSFATGDFGDPSYLHGATMPGLKEISAAASKGDLQIHYTELADGAEIRYEAQDPWIIIALHLWFQAQVGDHGAHAVSKP